MNRYEELEIKLERCRGLISQLGVKGLVLRSRANFAWITCGGQNYVNAHSEAGIGSVLVTREAAILLANNIEIQRLAEEELGTLADEFDLGEYPWHEPAGESQLIVELLGGGDFAADSGGASRHAASEVQALRYQLTGAEVERYRELGRLTSELTEKVCRELEPGLSEHEVAGRLFAALTPHGVRVPVYLVAADERLQTRRHPIVTDEVMNRRVMVVVCAERGGLWVNLTRLVNFVPITDDLRDRHRACCEVDATANAVTRPGRRLAEIFAEIQGEYERQGYAEEWRLHHQGGSTGYNGRDVFATPSATTTRVEAEQAFAWNPSITGTKSEDTILVHEDGFEFLSQPGKDWPTIAAERNGNLQLRADILDLS